MRQKKATFVCYADPPCASTVSVTQIDGKLIVPPRAWIMPQSKKAALSCVIGDYNWDKDKLKQIRGANILDAAWNPIGGLIVLGELPFDYIIAEKVTSLCACISHDVSCKRNDVTYLSHVLPSGFIPQSGSGGCNPGAMLHFPRAERFSVSVYKHKVTEMYDFERIQAFIQTPKINSIHAKKYFPDYNFESNIYLENRRQAFEEV